MSNLNNSFHFEGRLVKEPKVFVNQDGSKKVIMTIAVDRNYKNKDGKYDTDFPEVECFVPADGRGPIGAVLDMIAPGDRIGVGGDVRTNVWTKEDGKAEYKTFLNGQTIALRETKTTSEAHRKNAAAKAAKAQEADIELPIEAADEALAVEA